MQKKKKEKRKEHLRTAVMPHLTSLLTVAVHLCLYTVNRIHWEVTDTWKKRGFETLAVSAFFDKINYLFCSIWRF